MSWIGKLGGGLAGWAVGGPLGALVGGLLGHQFDRGLGTLNFESGPRLDPAERQQIFFVTTFTVMGHLAKADGRVSEQEIQAARQVMHRMRLHPEAVRQAIEAFTKGKQPGFALDAQLQEFRASCGRDRTLVRAFLEFQMDLVLSKGGIKSSERERLWYIAEQLGVSRVDLAQLEAVLRAQRSFGGGREAVSRGDDELLQAYSALGLEKDATDRDVKLAYRRLMNTHHPDKLVSRGLPDAMLEAAKERTREINSAYEVIKSRRGLK